MKHIINIVIPLLKAQWEDVAYNLDYESPTIDGIKESCHVDPKKCCQKLFKDWLDTNHGIKPKTWSTLLNAIVENEDFTKATEDILEKLETIAVVS